MHNIMYILGCLQMSHDDSIIYSDCVNCILYTFEFFRVRFKNTQNTKLNFIPCDFLSFFFEFVENYTHNPCIVALL